MSAELPAGTASLVCGFEGFSSRPYRDIVGVWTIGYGSTHLADGSAVNQHTPPVTKAEGVALMVKTLQSTADFVQAHIEVPVTDPEFSALISFTYNVGLGAFEHSTLLRKLNAGDREGASAQFPVWNRAGGKVSTDLTRRRAAERALFDSSAPASQDVDAPANDDVDAAYEGGGAVA